MTGGGETEYDDAALRAKAQYMIDHPIEKNPGLINVYPELLFAPLPKTGLLEKTGAYIAKAAKPVVKRVGETITKALYKNPKTSRLIRNLNGKTLEQINNMRELNADLYHGWRDPAFSQPFGIVREDGERFFVDASGKVFDRIDKNVEPLFTMEKGAHPLFDDAMEFAAKTGNESERIGTIVKNNSISRDRLVDRAAMSVKTTPATIVEDAAAGVLLPLGGASAYYGVTGNYPQWFVNLEQKERELKKQEEKIK